jgi:hypothetical protein
MLTRVGWLLLMVSVSAAAGAQTAGTITGTVLDETGAPLAQAEVLASKMEAQRAGNSLLQYHETDPQGRFTIENLPWGTYSVSARKEDDGYPGPLFGLYPAHSEFMPLVTLQPSSPTASLTLRLPPKAGAIQSISVVDAVTGMEMNSAAVILRRAAQPDISVETSTTMTPILVPSNADVSIEITAAGYKPWPAKDEPKSISQIRLNREQGARLDVKLAPQGSKVNSAGIFSAAPYAPARNIARPQPKPSSPVLSKGVEPFSITASDILVPLERLARQYRVPIGFESLPHGAGTEGTAGVRIDVGAGTVRDVLDAIMAAYPAYSWEETHQGVINVFPKDHPGSLLDVALSNYSETNADRGQAINDLLRAREVERWKEHAGVTAREQMAEDAPPPNGGPTIAHLRVGGSSSVRTILNFLLLATGSNYWAYYRWGDHNQFFSLSMGD